MAARSAIRTVAGLDVAVPTPELVHSLAGTAAAATLVDVRKNDVVRDEEAPCGESGQDDAAQCSAHYSFALVEYTLVIEEVQAFGNGPASSLMPDETFSFTEVVGVTQTARDDLNAIVERARDSIVESAPLTSQFVLLLRGPRPDSVQPELVAWALVGENGSLVPMFQKEPGDTRPLWTDDAATVGSILG